MSDGGSVERDISSDMAEREAQARYRASEEELSRIFDLTPALICVARPDGSFEKVNAEWERVLGFSVEEVMALGYANLIHPDDIEPTMAEVERQLKGAATARFVNRYRHKDGSYRVLEWQATPSVGGVLYAAASDITERKRAEELLRESEATLQYAQRVAHVGNWDWNPRTDELFWSQENYRIYGLPLDMHPSVEGFMDTVDPAHRERVAGAIEDALAGREPYDLDMRIVRPDGSKRVVHAQAEVSFDETGKPTRMFGTVEDITERKRAEEALRASEQRYRSLVEDLPDAVMVHQGGLIRFVNSAAMALFGAEEASQLVGLRVMDRVHPVDREAVRERLASAQAIGSIPPREERVFRLDGSEIWVEVTGSYVEFDGEEAVQLVVRDLAERKQAQEERRALLARMVEDIEGERARIADDIHDDSVQAMTVVSLRLATLRRGLTDPEQIEGISKLEESVVRAIDRLRHLIFELRPRVLDTGGLAAALRLHLERDAAEQGYEFHIEDRLIEEPSSQIRTIAFRIAQEALVNARKHANAKRIEVLLHPSDGGLLVRVSDDGVGFDPGHVADEGVPGHLGLEAMQERARLAGGTFKLDSRPGEGTTVEFWLPLEG